jgi:hypothetical protein
MPKKAVVEFECDRCGRTWYADADVGSTPSLSVFFKGPDGAVIEEADYQVLCGSCASACANYVNSIVKELKKSSPKRGAKGEEAGATPSPPPPPRRPTSGTSSAASVGSVGGGTPEAPYRSR